ncbi:hypothetical protein H6P81_007385 [Aristolochia fimbriata]|uniref:peptidyl-tRNA hydrolase n=1 Tax=Aristolochia fimbriata TaxID=158543 RepID=A0AAV7F2V5_ARIFI|nr:hypothetical protein H6P81_007385 [Aristolochia fimbriata]
MQPLSLGLSIPLAVFSAPAISSRSSCSTGRSLRTLFFPFVCEFRGFRRTSCVLMSNVPPVSVPVSADENATPCESRNPDSDVLIQYVVMRRDLIDTWPLGSILAQGCHASVAAIWAEKDDLHSAEYCSEQNLDRMHKVVLEVKGETQIINLSEKLVAGGIAHKLWIEQPENIPTCLATKPYPKSVVSSFFRKLKLCK